MIKKLHELTKFSTINQEGKCNVFRFGYILLDNAPQVQHIIPIIIIISELFSCV